MSGPEMHHAWVVGIEPHTGRVFVGLGEEGETPTAALVLCPCHGALDLANEIRLHALRAMREFPQHGAPARREARRRPRGRR